ncbi:hypothetical protein PENSPDRAFT_563932, partial [Peniophora sp. CONT]
FLREMIRRKGRGDAFKLTCCPDCKAPGRPEYSCGECEAADLCRACIIRWHRYQPFHPIYRHTAGWPERVDPSDLGLRIQLGHLPGQVCKWRETKHVDHFTVLHTTGMFRIRVDFCDCDEGKDVPRYVQLLRRGLWPSTVDKPESATTFQALDDFSRLSLMGRLTAYDYHRAAAARSDGAGLRDIPASLLDFRQQFMTAVHGYRHITIFMRAGRGHEPNGIEGTPSGACAVRCPACPDKDLNLAPGWASRAQQWLFRAVYSLDANFRLSNRLSRSTNHTDPYLNHGSAYMPPATDYQDHLDQMDKEDIEQPSDCSRFGAINQANMKAGRGLRTTGMAACTCRHEFWQPNGLTTLRKGERYVSVDYAFCSAMKHSRAPSVMVTYDIACQWHKKLKDRLEKIPEQREVYTGAMAMVELIVKDQTVFCVPKFHLYAHRVLCQVSYAIGWTIGTGALDGEGPERCWSGTNGAASSLREMGPGTMHDTMDDICGAWNWAKVCGIGWVGLSLSERMWRAVLEGRTQSAIFTEFTDALKSEEPEAVEKWMKKVELWEAKPAKHKNPYQPAAKSTSFYSATIKQIQLETVQAQGRATTSVAARQAKFLLLALQIEADRYRVSTKRDDDGETITQATTRTKALNSLVREIEQFRDEQERLMPRLHATLSVEERNPDRTTSVTMKLWLPSDMPKDDACSPPGLRALEMRLRWASMSDELDNLMHQLRLRGCLNRFKILNISGQRANTRARTAQDAVDANVKAAANAYRRHRTAYFNLVGAGDWEKTMRELVDSDCRGLGDRLIEQIEKMSAKQARDFVALRKGKASSGETKYTLPWIWYRKGDPEDSDGLKITDEWLKSRARARNWVEEVWLVDEEMGRVLRFNESIARMW